MKKTRHLLTLCAALMLLLQPVSAQDYLNVVKVNEDVRSFPLDDIERITFDADNIYILPVGSSTEQFSFSEVAVLTFVNPVLSIAESLSTQNKNDIDVFYSAALEKITIKSSRSIKQITVYNMLGRVVKELKPHSLQALQTSQAEISMQNTPSGLYLVSAVTTNGKVSKKFVRL
jgi:hypothetical protein